jgi:hypothetical protein
MVDQEQVQEKQEKRVSEFVEDEKTLYSIEYRINPENDLVEYLELERRYLPLYPYGNYSKIVWKIDYSSPTLMRITVYTAHENWNGTGSEKIMEAEVDFFFNEDPWFLTSELKDYIERYGVKVTIRDILHDLLEYFRDSLRIKEVE